MTRILIISDTHCGHRVGLTPPEWQYHPTGNHLHDKFAKIQSQMWNWFEEKIKEFQPIDRLIINGDAIDGKGQRSGGTELITSDRLQQALMVESIVTLINPREIAMTFGTPYHVGLDEDMEQVIADKLGASIESHLERTIDGVRIDARHFIGGSSIPHGRYTALAREDLWRLIWATRTDKEPPHIVIRSHVHYHAYKGDEYSTGIITPAMQGLGSKYGSRLCSGTVTIGFIVIDCENGGFKWKLRYLPLNEQVSAWRDW